jgi:hypothetical protein
MLVIIQRHSLTVRPTIDLAMLTLLMVLSEHSVEILGRGMIWRSGWRWHVGTKLRAYGRRAVAGYVPRMMMLCVLWVVVVPSTLLRKSVPIGHLMWPQSTRGRRSLNGLGE